MAVFSSLPPELVARIVHLAVPPFGAALREEDEREEAAERRHTLLDLCKVNRALATAASELLHRQVHIAPWQTARFAHSLAHTGYNRIVRHLHGDRFGSADYSVKALAEFAVLVLLLERLPVDTLSFSGCHDLSLINLSLCTKATTLIIDNSTLDHTSLYTVSHRFLSLRRLFLYDVSRFPLTLLDPSFLPNLRSLAYDAVVLEEEPDQDPNVDLPDLDAGSMAPNLLPQLRAISLLGSRGLAGLGDSFEVLDLDIMTQTIDHQALLPHLPPSLRVLRVTDNNTDTILELRDLLTSPNFRPRLLEVHLAIDKDDAAKNSAAWSAVQAHCAKSGIAMADLPGPMCQGKTHDPLWAFLDGVKKRLNLDV